jgi:hypothetical protein
METVTFLSGLTGYIFWPGLIVTVIMFFVRQRRQNLSLLVKKPAYLLFSNSIEEELSQWTLFLAIPFLGASLFVLHQWFNISDPLSILFIISIIAMLCAYYFRAPLVLLAGIVGFSSWLGISVTSWMQEFGIRSFSLNAVVSLFFILVYIFGRMHQNSYKFRMFSKSYLVLGAAAVLVMLFMLSRGSQIHTIRFLMNGEAAFASWKLFSTLLLLMIGIFASLTYVINKKMMVWSETFSIIIVSLTLCLLSIWVTSSEQWTYQFILALLNFVLFSYSACLIITGYLRRHVMLINVGTLALFVFIITKYFDWFFSSLDKGLFFLGAGLLFFVVGGLMENGRRKVVENVEEEVKLSE